MKYLPGLACALALAAGCAASADDDMATDSDVAAADPAADPAATDPAAPAATEAAATAPRRALPQPYISMNGSTTVAATPSLDSGTVVIDGGTELAASGMATYVMTTGAMAATAEVTVNPAPGAAFQYLVSGTGGGYSTRQLRIERDPGSDALVAASTAGLVTCGALPSGRPTTIAVAFDGAAKTFDVRIAGASTPCTRLATRVSGPVTGFRLVDLGSIGYGGRVEFSNLGLRY